MEIIYVLIPLSIVLLVVAIALFIWAVNSGQFDDMDTPAWRILVDDKRVDDKRVDKKQDDEKRIDNDQHDDAPSSREEKQ